MTFFVMYDIEDDKIRKAIAKYLLSQGCMRIQGSVFLADLSVDKYKTIKETVATLQGSYDNNDSILLVPVDRDNILSMDMIGRKIRTDIILGSSSVLFF